MALYCFWRRNCTATLDWRNIDEDFTQGMLTGNYLLQWSGGGYNVDGEVWGAAGSDPSDFPK